MAGSDYVVREGGGMRVVHGAGMGRDVNEAGLSSISGGGNWPRGDAVLRALRATPTNYGGRVVVRITGTLAPWFTAKYRGIILGNTYSRGILKTDAVIDLTPISGGQGGSGLTSDSAKLPGDTSGYPNTFLRIMSEISGFGWQEIETVQFFP